MFPGPIRGVAASVVLVALAALGLSGPASAARWDTYNNANSLNSVTAVGGIVWCASDVGVHYYDTDRAIFTRIAKGPGQLASNAVAEVEMDVPGNTWFATRDGGVSVLQTSGAWRTLDAFDGLPSTTVNCLEPMGEGMWVGTDKGVGFFRNFALEGAWPDGVNPSPFASNNIQDILLVGDSVWVATEVGVYVTKADEGISWSRRATGLLNENVRSLAHVGDEVWCVADYRVYRGGQTGAWTGAEEGLLADSSFSIRAQGDRLLVGTNGGVFTRTSATPWSLLGVGVPRRAWVTFDDAGGYWAGNIKGLWRWSGTDTAWSLSTSPGPRGNHVYGLAMDGSNVWITTQFDGASRFDGTSWRTFIPKEGAAIDTTFQSPDYLIGLFVDSNGYKWIGDWGSSIARVDDANPTLQVTHYYGPEEGGFDDFNTFGWAGAEDLDGNVWIGLDTPTSGLPPPPKGLHRLSPNGDRATFNPQSGAAMLGSQVRAIAFGPGPGFEMWVGYARGGVDIFNDPTLATRSQHLGKNTESDQLLDDDIWAIEMNGDSVWIATSAGLNRFSRATRKMIEKIGTQPPTSNGAVNPFAIDRDGGVWWATTAGVYHRKLDRSVEVFNASNSPLLSDDITSIGIDRSNGDVWIGTTSGVNRYDPDGDATGGGPVAAAGRFTSYPNPAFMSVAGVRIFGADVAGSFEGNVFDIRGRMIRSLRGNATSSGLWDAKDEEGRQVAPGLYFIRVTQSGVTRTGRVVLVR